MADRKVVLFNFWGVVVSSGLDAVLHKLEDQHKLQRGLLSTVTSREDGAMRRGLRGAMTLSQMIPVFEEECVQEARVQGATLPSDWSARVLLDDITAAMLDVQAAVLQVASRLRRAGLQTAVLLNHWVDDLPDGDATARLLTQLGGHFDLVLQSCHSGHMVPEAAMLGSALKLMGVTSEQALWVDKDQDGVAAAKAAGMKSIMVEDLEKMEEFTGVQVMSDSRPPSCRPDDVSHGYVTIRPGVRTHYVEAGSGPPVLMCHGFPESWFSWRYQIPALAAAGFRVLALDMKGYGESTAPPDIEEYSQQRLCEDLITFMDKLALPQVTLLGHDWGGALVWNMAQVYPERVRAVASLNTPLFPVDPAVPPSEKLKAIPIFDYQLYFAKPGAAEAEMEKDLERTFKIFFFSGSETTQRPPISTAGVCARGGLFVGLPEDTPRSAKLSEDDLQFYVSQYKDGGFRRPLNWYRNGDENWRWMCSRPRAKLLMPALMVTAGKDPVLLPAFTKGMDDLIHNLSRGHIEECGHWTQMDKPAETNDIMIKWLKETHNNKMAAEGVTAATEAGGVTVAPKL